MTLENKKMFAMVGSGFAGAVTIAGIVLMATQIPTQGAGFFVGYLFFALTILAVGMFITWLPNMKNNKWGFRKVDGKLKWCKDESVADPRRTRLIWWPLLTISLEFYGVFDFSHDLWQRSWMEELKGLFMTVTFVLFLIWCIGTARKKNRQL